MTKRAWWMSLSVLILEATASAAPVRVATWNVQSVGAVGTAEHTAAVAVLNRVDADVLLLQEVNGSTDETNARTLATEAGYAYTAFAPQGSFGGLHDAVFSKLPFTDQRFYESSDLSVDPTADEITRTFVRVTVSVGGNDLTVMSLHLKSGSTDNDEFRRAVEALRVTDALADLNPATDSYLIAGDMNEELGDVLSPAAFSSIPAGMPVSYSLGSDLAVLLPSPGIENDPFSAMFSAGLTDPGAAQLDGSWATRPSSGRRLDYVLVSDTLLQTWPDTQVYDSADEGLGGSLPLAGGRPSSTASGDASDHLLVFADLDVPAGGGAGFQHPGPGDLVLSEFMANPSTCPDDTGEWIEVYNRRNVALDLGGMEIVDQGGSTGVVGGHVIVPAHGLALLGRSDAASFCGPVMPDGFYGSTVYLNNSTDSIALRYGGATILQTPVYPAAAATAGVSVQRDPWSPQDWCLSTSPIGAELATPGAMNSHCPP
ncbi:MAG: endonuclease/exonuclease/phosphatase family protein [Alphaproteobacteria bacterium]|nr:endonuclease/exonuclease/phosphatase family protein [Alphaproteobacteria bacterium]MCB9698590.1 endonuclease/exonuclease/phosphatase family protein [Alphaproteobacteria bacterium]